ncbi:hypothetical protein SKAU_G00256210 [Synaphobranchus kaupii]|uniref:Uncharacterized protein n=1 Tax=Synaphobranchus kaupii TaxID=118154 RepID=A0A9Q1F3X0_SYNKA|nr:hypothetical protein SKAU_G00256210 [Synaphobranchus kaupii]
MCTRRRAYQRTLLKFNILAGHPSPTLCDRSPKMSPSPPWSWRNDPGERAREGDAGTVARRQALTVGPERLNEARLPSGHMHPNGLTATSAMIKTGAPRRHVAVASEKTGDDGSVRESWRGLTRSARRDLPPSTFSGSPWQPSQAGSDLL